jgi:dihydrofolate reductase
MSSVRVHCVSASLDGYASGEGQRLDAPFGHAGRRLLAWFDATRSFRQLHGVTGGSTNADDGFASRWTPGVGADIMGRNMFGPRRGPWEDLNWTGWWGNNPPYHNPVFVLTHHPRPTLEMEGGTTFHFIDASPAEALAVAREAAGELDVRIGGGNRRPSASSSRPTSSTICTSPSFPLSSAVASHCGKGWRVSKSAFASSRRPLRAA